MIKPDIPQLDPLRLQVRKHALLNEISAKPSRRWWRFTVPATALVAAVAVALVLWTPTNREVSVVDWRGDMTMVQYTGPQSESLCMWTPQGVAMSGRGHVKGREPLGDRLFADFAPQLGMTDVRTGSSVQFLTGRVSPKVGKVVIGTEDGLEVTATTDNGWVVAWWPSLGKPKYVRLYDQAGGVLQTAPIPVRDR